MNLNLFKRYQLHNIKDSLNNNLEKYRNESIKYDINLKNYH
jgi:hypothetical protein